MTGGAGYVGSHACKALAQAGYFPVVYDSLVTGHRWAVKWGPLEIGDILDQNRLDEVFRQHRPSAVLHFAAFAYVGESVTDPAKYYRNNVGGSLALLEAMRAAGVDRMVFSSSCATYGIPEAIPIAETAPQNPVSPYGASKLMIERMLADYSAAYGLSSMSLRYFNAAGADPAGEIGEDHGPETHLIPLALEAAAGGKPLTVFGTDYDTPDGTCIRDYIHVADLADAHVRALSCLRDTAGTFVVNLGTGVGSSVAEIVRTAEKITARPVSTELRSRRAGDPPVLVADSSRARRELGWFPRRSGLEEIVASAWSWRQKHGPAATGGERVLSDRPKVVADGLA